MNDLDLGFRSSAARFESEGKHRRNVAGKALAFNVSYLDDYCRALMPHDLVLIAARTGAGKTTLAELIATSNAEQGKRVHYFALEAEPDEIERHLLYRAIAREVFRRSVRECAGINYPDWYLGKFDQRLGFITREVQAEVASRYRTLNTWYKIREFTSADITKLFLAVRNETDLIVLDHLHYVDTPVDQSENRAQKAITTAIRDCALSIGVPIVVVAHLRKRGNRKALMPDADDVMGSSDITKIATRLILIAPARDQDCSGPEQPTYMQVEKDRLAGGSKLAALIAYDLRTCRYSNHYHLGMFDPLGETFTLLSGEKPRWAQGARD